MKRKIAVGLITLLLAVNITGCKGKEKEEELAPVIDVEDDDEVVADSKVPKSNVTLGKYKGIEVEKEEIEITDEDVEQRIADVLAYHTDYEDVTDRAVAEGDIANIDYVGSMDGEEFEGGADEGYDLDISNNTFIEGFSDQIIGAEIGSNFDIEVTFPEDYQKEDMQGKEAVFNITLNSIQVPIEAELNDEFVAENTEYENVDAYRAGLKEELKEEAEQTAESTAQSEVWAEILESSTVEKLPMSKVNSQVEFTMKMYASYYGMEAEQLSQAFNMEEDEYYQQMWNVSKENVKSQLVIEAIADAEGLAVSDDEYKEQVEELAASFSNGDVEAFEEEYGKDYIRTQILSDKVFELIMNETVEK